MNQLDLSSRELVALYLHIQNEGQSQSNELRLVAEKISRFLCGCLSIEQFEELESLFTTGYEFKELE